MSKTKISYTRKHFFNALEKPKLRHKLGAPSQNHKHAGEKPPTMHHNRNIVRFSAAPLCELGTHMIHKYTYFCTYWCM